MTFRETGSQALSELRRAAVAAAHEISGMSGDEENTAKGGDDGCGWNMNRDFSCFTNLS